MQEEGKGLKLVRIRMIKEKTLFSGKEVTDPERAVELLSKKMAQLDREMVAVLNLNLKNQVLNMNVVSIGTLNASLVHPREVFKTSILSNAASILVLHNHPSGVTLPSAEDLTLTKRLALCGTLIGIELMDHIIVGGSSGAFRSLRQDGILDDLRISLSAEGERAAKSAAEQSRKRKEECL